MNPFMFSTSEQGPVVLSIVSLTSLLRSQLVNLQLHYHIHIYFLLRKREKFLAMQKLLIFFQ